MSKKPDPAGPGRPEFEPTEEQREMVKAMTAYGIPQFDIGKVLGISPPTLRKHFWFEIETAAITANSKVAQALFRTATSGLGRESVAAQIFWLKSRAGWRDVSPAELGKKEEAREAANTAGDGTDWGDDLSAPTSSLN